RRKRTRGGAERTVACCGSSVLYLRCVTEKPICPKLTLTKALGGLPFPQHWRHVVFDRAEGRREGWKECTPRMEGLKHEMGGGRDLLCRHKEMACYLHTEVLCMFWFPRMRRFAYCKVVLATSLVWVMLDMFILLYFSECNKCDDKKERGLPGRDDALTRPRDGPGEGGKPVVIPKENQEKMKEMFKINQFNLMASEMIALNRSLPDVRLEGCKNKLYPDNLPRTSVVIVFHNEAWSTLLRTVHSVIDRSPHTLLEEIVLVDDASERDFLKRPLEQYVRRLEVPVRVVITFLDAHCECTTGWLEPLLARIKQDKRTVVCPIIDVISDDTFEYMAGSDMTYGGFNWKLNFRWYPVPQREMDRRKGDRTLPVRTPTMAGGLFSIDRDYFQEIGTYDAGMDIWGGRTWKSLSGSGSAVGL
ncbi:hypothetical protein INR49_024099, partial [Caranx melampygus]